MTRQPRLLSIKEAAALTGCDESTIKRDLRDGRYAAAQRDESDRTRAWRIPISDLVAAGRYRPPLEAVAASAVAEHERTVRTLRQELDQERRAHSKTAGLLAAAEVTLTAERRHTAVLERLIGQALDRHPLSEECSCSVLKVA